MNIKKYVEDHAILDSDENVVVKELWDGRYRVNVWKQNPNKISQSFFIKVSNEGVISCNPSMGA